MSTNQDSPGFIRGVDVNALKWSWGGSRVRLDEHSRPTDRAWELVESRFLFERDKYVRVLAVIRTEKSQRPGVEKTVA